MSSEPSVPQDQRQRGKSAPPGGPRPAPRDVEHSWLSRVKSGDEAIYLNILRALEDAIGEGELQLGDQLPPQRTIARALGVDVATVTRAFTIASNRGLVQGTTGRGTFVSASSSGLGTAAGGFGANSPPAPNFPLSAAIRDTTRAILSRNDLSMLLAYQNGAPLAQRQNAVGWLRPVVPDASAERMILTGGAQAAIVAVLTAVINPGETLVVEPLTYGGIRALAEYLRIKLVCCPSDSEGFLPDELAEICAIDRPAAIFCISSLHTAWAVSMGLERRKAIAETARRADVLIIEDDAYGRAPAEPALAIAAFAPERTYYITTMAKALAPGFRVGFLLAPTAGEAQRLLRSLNYMSGYPTPLSAAIVVSWIQSQFVDEVLAAVQDESRKRRKLAKKLLPRASGASDAYHVWIDLPGPPSNAFLDDLRTSGSLHLLATADKFAATPVHPHGFRVALGPGQITSLEIKLDAIAAALSRHA